MTVFSPKFTITNRMTAAINQIDCQSILAGLNMTLVLSELFSLK
jgi:hypothetical protein